MTSVLFTPLRSTDFIGVRNRIVMSAMTRGFSDSDHRATPAMCEYYRRRASGGAGLILTEGIVVHPSGDGYKDVPRIVTDAQARSWKPVLDAVHAEGAIMACQLWHCGRISHSDFTDGAQPVSSTARRADGINRQNDKPYDEPCPLTADQMRQVNGYFQDAARRALDVGFDAVELHLGHGYLADQFLDARVNDRTDAYGGSIENRCRFTLELVEAVLAVAPAEKVILRISPARFMGGPYDWPDMADMLNHLLPALWSLGARTLDVSCANADYFQSSGRVIRMIKPLWPGVIIGGASLTQTQAEAEVREALLDLVTWGRAFIANPDLARKFETNTPPRVFENAMRDVLE